MIVVLAVGCSAKLSFFYAVTTMIGVNGYEPTRDTRDTVIRPVAEAIKDMKEICLPC
jgi:hypothetical protein